MDINLIDLLRKAHDGKVRNGEEYYSLLLKRTYVYVSEDATFYRKNDTITLFNDLHTCDIDALYSTMEYMGIDEYAKIDQVENFFSSSDETEAIATNRMKIMELIDVVNFILKKLKKEEE